MAVRSRFCIERPLARASPGDGPAAALNLADRLWPPGSVLRVRFIGGSPRQRLRAIEQAGWWSAVANVRFEFGEQPDAELRVAFDAGECPWSHIGTDARQVPIDQPTMNLAAADGAIAAHEFGHALGLPHVRQNPTGAHRWNFEAIARDLAGPPLYCSADEARHFAAHRSLDAMIGTSFDPESIMLEFFPAEWLAEGRAVRPQAAMSAMDRVVVAKLYPRR